MSEEHSPPKQAPPHLDHVMFELEDGGTETMWAEAVAPAEYRLLNSPFYAYGVSFEDVVGVRRVGGVLRFDRIIKRGGRSTYRVLLFEPGQPERFVQESPRFEALGCTFESVSAKYYSVDVPAVSDVDAVYRLLQHGEDSGWWEFEEAHCGHPPKT